MRKSKKLKIKSLTRFICSVGAMLFTIMMLSFVVMKPTLSHGDLQYHTLYIDSGDTLWSIANNERENNAYYENKSVSYIVHNLKKVNNLSNSNIYVGQELLIPTI